MNIGCFIIELFITINSKRLELQFNNQPNSQIMLKGWRYVLLGAAVLGAVLTPSTDPITQSLLAGAVLFLYFGGIFMVKAIGR